MDKKQEKPIKPNKEQVSPPIISDPKLEKTIELSEKPTKKIIVEYQRDE